MKQSLILVFIVIVLTQIILALPPPLLDLNFQAETTDNLFADSVSLADSHLSLTLDIEQSLDRSIKVFYSGIVDGYHEISSLSSAFNQGGLDFNLDYKDNTNVWMQAGGSDLQYRQEFSLYNRQQVFLSAGGAYQYNDAVSLRIMGNADWTAFPSYTDTASVDYRNLQSAMGMNIGFKMPIGLDFETGYQQRYYYKMRDSNNKESQVNTSFFFANFRISTQITRSTGASIQCTWRDQLANDRPSLRMLYLNGVDPSDLLWDGWLIDATITRYLSPWKIQLITSYSNLDFVEISLSLPRIPNLKRTIHRKDDQYQAAISGQRIFLVESIPMQVILYSIYILEITQSNDPYYTYTSNSFQVGFTFRPIW